jgi:hypothetical protein
MALVDNAPPWLCARLPSGDKFVPGAGADCPGPDAYGACSRVPPATEPPCAGATWRYDSGETSWEFVFRSGSSVCPVAVLDPLGPLALPQD